MVSNKADTIEEYILKKLSEGSDGSIEVKRTELADKVNCAPSQISYVLSTRFTHDRGFHVESQRGLGGYIRITIVEDTAFDKKTLYRSMVENIDANTPFETVKAMVSYLVDMRMLTTREAEMMKRTIYIIYQSEAAGKMTAEERAKIITSIFVMMAKI